MKTRTEDAFVIVLLVIALIVGAAWTLSLDLRMRRMQEDIVDLGTAGICMSLAVGYLLETEIHNARKQGRITNDEATELLAAFLSSGMDSLMQEATK